MLAGLKMLFNSALRHNRLYTEKARQLEACRPRDSHRVDVPTTCRALRLVGAFKSPFSSGQPRAYTRSGFTFTELGFKSLTQALGNALR
jgi:hypothetical protein